MKTPADSTFGATAEQVFSASDRREFLKIAGASAVALGLASIPGTAAFAATKERPDMFHGADNFYKSDKVTLQKVSFKDQYQMRVVGNLFVPKAFDRSKAHPALVVSHPMGAVKEQSANLYATKMAEQGFVTLAIDLPGFGHSDGRAELIAPDSSGAFLARLIDEWGLGAPHVVGPDVGTAAALTRLPIPSYSKPAAIL